VQVKFTKPEIERYIDGLVSAGEFSSADAVLEEAVERMMTGDMDVTLSPDDIEAIAEADAQIERGEYVDFDIVAAELRAKYGIKK
jgi:Arc/MetJ-type ribon-helix-helix transcriptional regulator